MNRELTYTVFKTAAGWVGIWARPPDCGALPCPGPRKKPQK